MDNCKAEVLDERHEQPVVKLDHKLHNEDTEIRKQVIVSILHVKLRKGDNGCRLIKNLHVNAKENSLNNKILLRKRVSCNEHTALQWYFRSKMVIQGE